MILHIYSGNMGGGGPIPFDKCLNYNEWNNLYNIDGMDGDFTN